MKSVKYIVLGALLTLGTLSAVFYSSCSKDTCGDVVCRNKSKCSGGVCRCDPDGQHPGIGGANCEVVYRDIFKGEYYGQATGDYPHSDSISRLAFNPDLSDTTVFNTMFVEWVDTNTQMFKLPVVIYDFSTVSTSFSVTPTPIGSYTVSGTGKLTTTTANFDLNYAFTGGGSLFLHFNNFVKH